MPDGSGRGAALDVTVTIAGQSSLVDTIGYAKPKVISIYPRVLDSKGGELITVYGENFGRAGIDTPSVVLSTPGGLRYEAASCNVTNTSSSIACRSVEGIGAQLMITVTIAGQSSTNTAILAGYLPPVVVSLTPSHGPTKGGVKVIITGRHFGTFMSGASYTILGATAYPEQGPGPDILGVIMPPGSGRVTSSLRARLPSGEEVQSVVGPTFTYDPPHLAGLEVLNFTDTSSTIHIVGENFARRRNASSFTSVDPSMEKTSAVHGMSSRMEDHNMSSNTIATDVLKYEDGDVIIRVPSVSDQIYIVVFDQRSNILPFDKRTPEILSAEGLVPSSVTGSFALANTVNTNGTSMVFLSMNNIDSSNPDDYSILLDEADREISPASISGNVGQRRVGILIPAGMGKRRVIQIKRKLNSILSLPISYDYASPVITGVTRKDNGEDLLGDVATISPSGSEKERTIVIVGENLAGPDVLVPMNGEFFIRLGSTDLCSAGVAGQNSSCLCTFENSHTRLECIVPPSFEINMALSFMVHGEEFFAPGFISFEPPVVDSINPKIANTQGSTIITMRGRNFAFGRDPPTVLVNSVPIEPLFFDE